MSARLIGRTGLTAGQDYPLTGVASIGAAPDSQIRIVAPGVSRKHARIVVEHDQYILEDAGATNGTFLNGGRVTRETLQHLDVITLGRAVDLIFLRRDSGNTDVPSDQITAARVQIADGPEAGTVVEVPKGEMTFGRAPSCNVVLASGLVSKVHARIRRTSSQLVLQDLKSINGTFVNGERVDSIQVLKNRDVINFGGVRTVTVAIEGPGALKPTVPAVTAADEPAFNQDWKTRFVWAPDELAAIEVARAEAMQLFALRNAPAASAKPAAAAAPKRPPVAKAEVKPPAAPAVAKPAADAKPAVDEPPIAPKPLPPPRAEVPTPVKAADVPVRPAPPPAPPVAASPAEADQTILTTPQADQTIITSPPPPRVRGLKLVGGGGPPFAVGLGAFVVGRAIGSDVRLDDRQVSRSHARLTIDEASASVEDLQTVNGTLVNGKEVKARQPLRDGDTVQFGATEFKVELITA